MGHSTWLALQPERALLKGSQAATIPHLKILYQRERRRRGSSVTAKKYDSSI